MERLAPFRQRLAADRPGRSHRTQVRAAQGSGCGMGATGNLAIVRRSWDASGPGVLRLPSGRLVRGRGLRQPAPDGPVPEFGLYLLGDMPPAVAWDARWVRWPDFRLPVGRYDAQDALREGMGSRRGGAGGVGVWRWAWEDRHGARLHRRAGRCVAATGSGLHPAVLRSPSGRDALAAALSACHAAANLGCASKTGTNRSSTSGSRVSARRNRANRARNTSGSNAGVTSVWGWRRCTSRLTGVNPVLQHRHDGQMDRSPSHGSILRPAGPTGGGLFSGEDT